MMLDDFVIGICLMNIIQVDILLNTFSRYSVWFHLVSYASFVYQRANQLPMLTHDLRVLMCIEAIGILFLYVVCWTFRWFRELQDRVTIISVKDSEARVIRAREAQKNRRRRKTVSAAEEVTDILVRCRSVLGAEADPLAPRPRSEACRATALKDAYQCIDSVIQQLARCDSQSLSERDMSTEADEADTEAMFIQMYKGGRRLDLSAAKRRDPSPFASGEDSSRAASARSLIAADRQSINIQGVDMPQLIMSAELNKVIGVDFGYRLLDHFKAGVPILQEVGWSLLAPYLPFLNVAEEPLRACLYAIERLHHQRNPYHNSCHPVCVAHYGMCLLNNSNIKDNLTQLECVGFIIATLVHDIGHPGRSSSFYINSNSTIALMMNDDPVLEGCHAFLMQRLFNNTL
eukprot:Blabericola_migrator_1__12057@NODE_741_length_6682_cov_71_114588_g531_i0_p2_GENE_NODE_741_length_6682_cov_71_114588_g531_i0NODE_741_length_6682_cov_71_114588_g531_i0_p2_ORF_typecomplete_len403_score55_83PDEase_I/PF00233_19/1_8e20HD/PF01966_22/0_41_NODE_741_length_6682_cov_71_114588_g531_i016382846